MHLVDLKFLEKVEGEHVSRELKNELWQRSRHCLTQLKVVPGKTIISTSPALRSIPGMGWDGMESNPNPSTTGLHPSIDVLLSYQGGEH